MGPLLRNIARYSVGALFGGLVAKGLISQELADLFMNDEWFLNTIQFGAVIAGSVLTEYLYAIAKERGWKT